VTDLIDEPIEEPEADSVEEPEIDALEVDETTFKRGRRRRYSFTMLPDWVLLAKVVPRPEGEEAGDEEEEEVAPGAKALYWALFLHVNQERRDDHGDTRVWPGQDKLLEISGVKSKTTLRKYLRQLKGIGAVDWKTDRNPRNRLRTQTIYVVHEEPEPGYKGPASISDIYPKRDR
jgi:hypothetical protein